LEFTLNTNDKKSLEHFLKTKGHLQANEQLEHIEIAGAGNMNYVLRATTSARSFILKQSKPWVQKYPSVAAPIGRIHIEEQFYQLVRSNETLRQYTPEIYWFDKKNHLLCMEDLGESSDFTSIYAKDAVFGKEDMAAMAKVVSALHSNFNSSTINAPIVNREIRVLNYAHIFNLPLNEANGFDLNQVVSGLQTATDKFRKDEKLKRIALELGDIYLNQQGEKLLHGDYYPGSWLKTKKGLRMIDPEFCFFGTPEFELGVTVAHLKMAQQSDNLIKDLFIYYHFDTKFDGGLFSRFSGIEMIRRLIGLAQLPLPLNLKERLNLLDEAYEFVVNG